MYKIIYSKQAYQALKKVPKNLALTIRAKIELLAKNSSLLRNNIKKLQGMEDSYRLRVGDWRIVYTIDNDDLIIEIVKIASRGGVDY